MSAQTTQLKRVRARISDVVKAFCASKVNQNFHASELAVWVNERVSRVSPGSPDRILRDLRQNGEVDYEVVSRGGSVYFVHGVTT